MNKAYPSSFSYGAIHSRRSKPTSAKYGNPNKYLKALGPCQPARLKITMSSKGFNSSNQSKNYLNTSYGAIDGLPNKKN